MSTRISSDEHQHSTTTHRNIHIGKRNKTNFFSLVNIISVLFYLIIDRVKVINGKQPLLSSENNSYDKNSEHDENEIPRLLNVLNWSPLEDLVTNKTPTSSSKISINGENERKSKASYNAVQVSIELQKKMLK